MFLAFTLNFGRVLGKERKTRYAHECQTGAMRTSEKSILLGTGVKIALAAAHFHSVGVALQEGPMIHFGE